MDRIEVAKGVEATRDFALLLREERALVISDLHLGFEGALAEQGVSIPRFQRRGILDNYLATILGDLNLPLNARADLGGYTIVHGHEEVSTLHPIVMGHEHPAVKLKDDLGATA